MRNHTLARTIAATIAAGALVLGLAACADDKPAPAPATTESAPTTESQHWSLWTSPSEVMDRHRAKPTTAPLWTSPSDLFKGQK